MKLYIKEYGTPVLKRKIFAAFRMTIISTCGIGKARKEKEIDKKRGNKE